MSSYNDHYELEDAHYEDDCDQKMPVSSTQTKLRPHQLDEELESPTYMRTYEGIDNESCNSKLAASYLSSSFNHCDTPASDEGMRRHGNSNPYLLKPTAVNHHVDRLATFVHRILNELLGAMSRIIPVHQLHPKHAIQEEGATILREINLS